MKKSKYLAMAAAACLLLALFLPLAVSAAPVRRPVITTTRNAQTNNYSCDCRCCRQGFCPPANNSSVDTPYSNNSYWEETDRQSEFAEEVLRLVNIERAKVGARPLTLAPDLMTGTAIRAEELANNFSHTRPDGREYYTAVPRAHRNNYWGENIAAGQRDPESVMETWMNSSGHRQNILNKNYRCLGVGHYYSETSEYGHYWVQIFQG